MVDCGVYLPRSSDERLLVIESARNDGHCVLVSLAGVLVGTPQTVLDSFRNCLAGRASLMNHDDTVISLCTDPQGRDCIAAYANDPGAIYLYGVSEAEFHAAFADLRADTLQ
jgi:hypothetical protein